MGVDFLLLEPRKPWFPTRMFLGVYRDIVNHSRVSEQWLGARFGGWGGVAFYRNQGFKSQATNPNHQLRVFGFKCSRALLQSPGKCGHMVKGSTT